MLWVINDHLITLGKWLIFSHSLEQARNLPRVRCHHCSGGACVWFVFFFGPLGCLILSDTEQQVLGTLSSIWLDKFLSSTNCVVRPGLSAQGWHWAGGTSFMHWVVGSHLHHSLDKTYHSSIFWISHSIWTTSKNGFWRPYCLLLVRFFSAKCKNLHCVDLAFNQEIAWSLVDM